MSLILFYIPVPREGDGAMRRPDCNHTGSGPRRSAGPVAARVRRRPRSAASYRGADGHVKTAPESGLPQAVLDRLNDIGWTEGISPHASTFAGRRVIWASCARMR